MELKNMNNVNNNLDKYNELITNYLNSSLQKEEEKILVEWLEKDLANKRYFDEFREIWLSSGLSSAQKKYNSKMAFERFKKKIGQTSGDKEYESYFLKRLTITIGKAAAVLLITYGLGIISFAVINSDKASIITYQEITVPAGSKTKLSLPDGTQVWLNSQSKLTYASNYNQDSREVKLEGEGYFKVARDKERPFIVKAANITVRALGTEFNVKCYPDEGFIEATLVKGSIKIEGGKDQIKAEKNNMILKPNERLTFIKKTGKLYPRIDSLQTEQNQKVLSKKYVIKDEIRKEQIIIGAIDPKPLIAWKDDKLIFTGERFEEIKTKLERWYGVSIQIKDEEILSYRFKGSFEKETLEQALEALRLASPFKYIIHKDQVIISK
jgi:transmembrane sensor